MRWGTRRRTRAHAARARASAAGLRGRTRRSRAVGAFPRGRGAPRRRSRPASLLRRPCNPSHRRCTGPRRVSGPRQISGPEVAGPRRPADGSHAGRARCLARVGRAPVHGCPLPARHSHGGGWRRSRVLRAATSLNQCTFGQPVGCGPRARRRRWRHGAGGDWRGSAPTGQGAARSRRPATSGRTAATRRSLQACRPGALWEVRWQRCRRRRHCCHARRLGDRGQQWRLAGGGRSRGAAAGGDWRQETTGPRGR